MESDQVGPGAGSVLTYEATWGLLYFVCLFVFVLLIIWDRVLVQADLKFTMYLRMSSNSWSHCLHLWSARITGANHRPPVVPGTKSRTSCTLRQMLYQLSLIWCPSFCGTFAWRSGNGAVVFHCCLPRVGPIEKPGLEDVSPVLLAEQLLLSLSISLLQKQKHKKCRCLSGREGQELFTFQVKN